MADGHSEPTEVVIIYQEAIEPRDGPPNETDVRLHDHLRKLVLQRSNGLSDAEFVQSVVMLVENDDDAGSLSLDEAVLAVLVRQGCSDILLGQVRRVLRCTRPIRTVKRFAAHARRDESTLRRHWKSICSGVELHDLLRLIELVHVVRATGSEQERADVCGIDVRTARSAALDLTGRWLRELIEEPSELIAAFQRWFRSDAGPLS